jgi:hypothetical protein
VGVAIADRDIGIAREEDAAVGQALERREAAERMIVGKGIVEKGAVKCCKIEASGESPGLVFRQLDQAPGQN